MGVDPARAEVALQSADLERIRRGAGRRSAGGPVRILAVGRLVPDKNLDGLIRAFAEAGFGDGEAELELRGIGPLAGELARAGGRGWACRCASPARRPRASCRRVYAAADVLALVSSYEPFGVTLREGAAAGLPLIASERAGAAGDVAVEGENAIVVDPDDRIGLVEALRRIVREPELRERLAAGSRAVTERHPPEADVEAWERAILRAASSAQARAGREPGP